MTAWHRKALERPAGWAKAMRAIETETLVTFVRSEGGLVPDGFGGFEPGAGITNWSIEVSAQMQRGPAIVSGEAGGDTIRARRWVFYIPLPLDPEFIPRTGDVAAFEDALGRPVEVPVRVEPWVPAGLADHLMVETEDLE